MIILKVYNLENFNLTKDLLFIVKFAVKKVFNF